MKIALLKKHLSELVIALLVLLVFLALVWRIESDKTSNNQINSLKHQLSISNANNSGLKRANTKLTGQLNEANQAINSLSNKGGFVSGASCQTQQLALAEAFNPGGAAGQRGEYYSYQNTSSVPCTVNGYPGFVAFDNKGFVMPNGPIQPLNGSTPKTITLNPGGKAYFLVTWHLDYFSPPHNDCLTASLVESTPPGDLLPLVITVNGTYICNEQLSVSALNDQAPGH